MEEQIDILNDQGEKTGQVRTYNEVHRDGLWHRTIHAWFVNSKGEILLQKRSMKKAAHPGLWDISVAGHISAGQTSIEAAKRETEEEIGLTLPDSSYEHLFSTKGEAVLNNGTYINREFHDVFLVHADVPVSALKPDSEEVAEMRWVSVDEFKKWIAGGGEPMVSHEEEYRKLIEYLEIHKN